MNNKGFTLIEVLCVIVLTSIIIILVFTTFGTTFSATRDEAYKIMKNNLLTAGYNYVNECKLGTIKCDFSFKDNNKFTAKDLYNYGYFKELESPIDGKNLGSCLILEATKDNGVVSINLIDKCYSNHENDIPVIKDDASIESGDINLEKPNQIGNGNNGNSNNGNNGNSNNGNNGNSNNGNNGNSNNGNNGNFNNGNNGNSNNGNNGNSNNNKIPSKNDNKQNFWNEVLDIILDMIMG